ncbi:MAG: hypothetical protein K5930_02685 [Treponemataceae bacterium]|nr:hypothetical protein [Treponemataceae bacterium]
MRFVKRIYEDYFKPNRLPSYKNLLETAKIKGYKMVGILDFYNILNSKDFDSNTKILINRHDIDTSPKIARKMFEIEKQVYGSKGSSTYYFRKSTIDVNLIKEIEEYGYETGYHYEEIADYEKKHRFRDVELIKQVLPDIQNLFIEDLIDYRLKTASKSLTVASHGDFINTRLQFQNYELLKNDVIIREKGKILVEAYDKSINDFVNERFADQILLDRFSEEVISSINRNTKIIMMLTHPRNWVVDIKGNSKENFLRLLQGIKYSI